MNAFGSTVIDTLNYVTSSLKTVGRAALHTISPNQFEYYMLSMELLNSKAETRAFMVLPVLPNNITETESNMITITKTHRGVVSIFNDSFVPKDIQLQGTFGRKFRLLLDSYDGLDDGSQLPVFGGNTGWSPMNMPAIVRSGYGLTKMMQRMLKESVQLDTYGQPQHLILNNYAFNTSYIVEVQQSSFNQSVENNMIWFYSLDLKAVAPSTEIKQIPPNDRSMITTVFAGEIAKAATDLTSTARKALGRLF